MDDMIKTLEKQIQKLEAKLGKDHFGGLLDKTGRIRDEKKLRKLKKELEALKK